ncbi:MAG: RnfABCDGE type electron transport complex subunit D [Nitrospira sp.]|nr:RnfABCDGE type electron transport complex subunit D [Nitrospira sp.]
METDKKNDVRTSTIRRDPRLYQIASLSTLLLYGLLVLRFEISIRQIIVTLTAAQLTQYAATRLCKLPAFDPKSALISSLSLCLLLRTDSLAVATLAAVITIGSKFVIRWKGKHVFNPTGLALVIVIASQLGWISPGQWGQVAWFGFLIVCLGSLVVTRAARADMTLAFLCFYIGLLFVRALWLGDPLTIPLHQIESGALLIFAFFMISDPKTTPDSSTGRLIHALLMSLAALYMQFGLFMPNGLLWGLITCAPLVPIFDRVFPGVRYDWSRPTAGQKSIPTPLSIPLQLQRRFS